MLRQHFCPTLNGFLSIGNTLFDPSQISLHRKHAQLSAGSILCTRSHIQHPTKLHLLQTGCHSSIHWQKRRVSFHGSGSIVHNRISRYACPKLRAKQTLALTPTLQLIHKPSHQPTYPFSLNSHTPTKILQNETLSLTALGIAPSSYEALPHVWIDQGWRFPFGNQGWRSRSPFSLPYPLSPPTS